MSGLARHFRTGALASTIEAGETLLDGMTVRVRNAAVYSNVEELNPEFGRHLRNDIYIDCDCALLPVSLGRLPAGAILHGGGEFLTTVQGVLLQEQIAPYLENDPNRVAELIGAERAVVDVAGPCLLIARFGIYTWGHWLGELLPKAALAEARYPGRFRYVVPSPVLTDATPTRPWIRIRESLLAYGIDASRLLPVDGASDVRFAELYAVGSVWSDHAMHPGAAQAMRKGLRPAMRDPSGAEPVRVALMREGDGRAIANADAVRAVLRDEGFGFHPVGRIPFWDQVRLFRSASIVFAVLGSDLTGLIYAREGVRVVSVAPSIFGDRFFYALILDRQGYYADVRGPVSEPNPTVGHRSSFVVDPDRLSEGLAALRAVR